MKKELAEDVMLAIVKNSKYNELIDLLTDDKSKKIGYLIYGVGYNDAMTIATKLLKDASVGL